MHRTSAMLVAGALALAGCGGPAADRGTAPAAAEEPTENRQLLDAARAPLGRAEAVEGIEMAQKRAMDAQIEEQAR